MGLEQTGGFKVIWQCEIDKKANQLLKKYYPNTPNHGDITKVNWHEVERPDVITAGFPCPSFSIAGKQGGFSDGRGALFFEIKRCAAILKPRILLLENVPNLLAHEEGRTFQTVLDTLGQLGYWSEYQILNSLDFGLAQDRKRVFIISHLRGERQRAIFPLGENGQASTGGGGGRPSTAACTDSDFEGLCGLAWQLRDSEIRSDADGGGGIPVECTPPCCLSLRDTRQSQSRNRSTKKSDNTEE